jgi:hypothetical protein
MAPRDRAPRRGARHRGRLRGERVVEVRNRHCQGKREYCFCRPNLGAGFPDLLRFRRARSAKNAGKCPLLIWLDSASVGLKHPVRRRNAGFVLATPSGGCPANKIDPTPVCGCHSADGVGRQSAKLRCSTVWPALALKCPRPETRPVSSTTKHRPWRTPGRPLPQRRKPTYQL